MLYIFVYILKPIELSIFHRNPLIYLYACVFSLLFNLRGEIWVEHYLFLALIDLYDLLRPGGLTVLWCTNVFIFGTHNLVLIADVLMTMTMAIDSYVIYSFFHTNNTCSNLLIYYHCYFILLEMANVCDRRKMKKKRKLAKLCRCWNIRQSHHIWRQLLCCKVLFSTQIKYAFNLTRFFIYLLYTMVVLYFLWHLTFNTYQSHF